MTIQIQLPKEGGDLYVYKLQDETLIKTPKIKENFKKRIAFSAAHVVANPLSGTDPLNNSKIDWDSTLYYRHHLWSMGLGVAEAMDTAQRGMGLNWEQAKELMRRSMKEAKSVNGIIACGAGTDHLNPSSNVTIDKVLKAYTEQCEFVESQGGQIILMASRALAGCAKSPEDYEKVYETILNNVSRPVIIHWLGDMFDPNLKGYWGYNDIDRAMEVCLKIINNNKQKIDGIKISLLDKEKEIHMRNLLPKEVKMYTGDDFNYPELILGDENNFSHALLGIFDAIAPAAATAMQALDNNDIKLYNSVLENTVPLSRHIFQSPTYAYKTGVVFMAYLNGHQNHFKMVGGAESWRSIIHLSDLFVLADKAGLLTDKDLAIERMQLTLRQVGIE